MRNAIIAALLTAASVSAAPAGAQSAPSDNSAPADRDCFRNAEIAGWGPIDRHTVRVRVNSRRQYALTTRESARRIRWEMAIAVSSPSGWICVGPTVDVQINSFGAIPHSYRVTSVARLPPPPDQPSE